MPAFTSSEGTAHLLVSATDDECFTNVTFENTLNRSLVNKIGVDTSENANDGNSVASGTITRAYGQGTDLLVSTLFDSKGKFDMVMDPSNVRTGETPIVAEVASGTVDSSNTVFFSEFHSVRTTFVVDIDGSPATLGTDYTLEYDNTRTVGQAMEVTFLKPPQTGEVITFDYTPETDSLLMHLECEITNVQVSPDSSSDDHVEGSFPYVARDWIYVLGPTNRYADF